jgi:hypothetical protein
MNRGSSSNWEQRNAYIILVEKPKAKKSLRRPRGRWVNTILMIRGEIGGAAWTGLIELRIGTSEIIL